MLKILAALLMVLVTITLADPTKAEGAEALDGDAHDLVGDEHFLKKYKKHYKHHAYPVPVHRVYHPVPVYHKKFHKG